MRGKRQQQVGSRQKKKQKKWRSEREKKHEKS